MVLHASPSDPVRAAVAAAAHALCRPAGNDDPANQLFVVNKACGIAQAREQGPPGIDQSADYALGNIDAMHVDDLERKLKNNLDNQRYNNVKASADLCG
jgi:hypothetical protein